MANHTGLRLVAATVSHRLGERNSQLPGGTERSAVADSRRFALRSHAGRNESAVDTHNPQVHVNGQDNRGQQAGRRCIRKKMPPTRSSAQTTHCARRYEPVAVFRTTTRSPSCSTRRCAAWRANGRTCCSTGRWLIPSSPSGSACVFGCWRREPSSFLRQYQKKTPHSSETRSRPPDLSSINRSSDTDAVIGVRFRGVRSYPARYMSSVSTVKHRGLRILLSVFGFVDKLNVSEWRPGSRESALPDVESTGAPRSALLTETAVWKRKDVNIVIGERVPVRNL